MFFNISNFTLNYNSDSLKKINIAIDGFSSCGKSTIAKDLAKEYNYIFVDSGAMYRAVTYFALENNIISNNIIDVKLLINKLSSLDVYFEKIENNNSIFLNGKNIENNIRSLEVANWVSKIAQINEVRDKLVSLQQKMGENKGVIMDGRDIGTVVFPDAELKLFITADTDIRVNRRLKDLDGVTFEEVKSNLLDRDKKDTERENSPLLQAKDAIVIDNTNLTPTEQMLMIKALIDARINIEN